MGACGSCSAEKDVVDTADVAIDDATGRAQSYTVKHGFHGFRTIKKTGFATRASVS